MWIFLSILISWPLSGYIIMSFIFTLDGEINENKTWDDDAVKLAILAGPIILPVWLYFLITDK